MGFLSWVARYIATDKLRSLGEDILAQGRRRFADELTRGRPKEEAARIAAKFMLKLAGQRSAASLKGAAGNVTRNASRAAAQAGRLLRNRFKG